MEKPERQRCTLPRDPGSRDFVSLVSSDISIVVKGESNPPGISTPKGSTFAPRAIRTPLSPSDITRARV